MKTSDTKRRRNGKDGGRRTGATADWRWADPKGLKVDPVLRMARLLGLEVAENPSAG